MARRTTTHGDEQCAKSALDEVLRDQFEFNGAIEKHTDVPRSHGRDVESQPSSSSSLMDHSSIIREAAGQPFRQPAPSKFVPEQSPEDPFSTTNEVDFFSDTYKPRTLNEIPVPPMRTSSSEVLDSTVSTGFRTNDASLPTGLKCDTTVSLGTGSHGEGSSTNLGSASVLVREGSVASRQNGAVQVSIPEFRCQDPKAALDGDVHRETITSGAKDIYSNGGKMGMRRETFAEGPRSKRAEALVGPDKNIVLPVSSPVELVNAIDRLTTTVKQSFDSLQSAVERLTAQVEKSSQIAAQRMIETRGLSVNASGTNGTVNSGVTPPPTHSQSPVCTTPQDGSNRTCQRGTLIAPPGSVYRRPVHDMSAPPPPPPPQPRAPANRSNPFEKSDTIYSVISTEESRRQRQEEEARRIAAERQQLLEEQRRRAQLEQRARNFMSTIVTDKRNKPSLFDEEEPVLGPSATSSVTHPHHQRLPHEGSKNPLFD